MRVLLVSTNTVVTPYPAFPIGACMVAAALRQAGHTVRLLDFLEQGKSVESMSRIIRDWKPDLVGVSIRNIDSANFLGAQSFVEEMQMIVRRIKDTTPVPIVLGGSGFSLMPEAILRDTGADYGIVGEGERLMTQFVNEAAQGRYPAQRCLRAGPALQGQEIPSADYVPDTLAFYLKNGNVAPVQTKRGCSARCIYCSYPLLEGSAIRPRDPAAVADDMSHLVDVHKAKYLFFTDSVFNDAEGRYLDVIAELEKRKLSIPWTAFFRPCDLDEPEVRRMKATGLRAAEFGSDAATDVTLAALGKGFTFREIRACNDLFVRLGVATAHYFMFGGPGETRQTVLEGIENIKSLSSAAIFISMGLRILPNTGLADIARREGVIREDDELLTPAYYISGAIEKDWLHDTLSKGFAGVRHCVFPPDAWDRSLQFLHKIGYSGSLWELLVDKNSVQVSGVSPAAGRGGRTIQG